MATKKPGKAAPKHLLSIAGFCSRVLEGTDNKMSGIAFLDHYIAPVAENRDPEERVPVLIWAFIAFKSRTFTPGELTGDHVLRLVLTTPKQKKMGVGNFPMAVPETATSFNFRIKLNLNIKTEGVYWLDVILDGRRYTRMPLKVSFQPVPLLTGSNG